MGEVKRKRPWEIEEDHGEDNIQRTFIRQLVICTFITIGIFIALNTKNNGELKQFIKSELTRNIETQDVNWVIDYVKDTAGEYIH